ncbi:methyltransferase domain-containing protein [Actinomycetes bacterium KLBMP 9797]
MGRGEELRQAYAESLCRDGAITRPEVAAAFAAVPREAFVVDGFHRREGGRVDAGEEGFLDAVYTNDVLVTKIVDGTPVSSSSQPSLMAVMIETLDLAPGMSVLEIGAGTGYNAALMAAVGARVTSIDVQPDVLARARAALTRAGVSGVEVHEADGYHGHPGSYDRIVVTVGITGVSPQWLEQLASGGFVLAPVAHVGAHPVLRVAPRPGGAVTAEGVCPAGFMTAAGPLAAAYPWMHPAAPSPLPDPVVTRPARFDPPLGFLRYYDLAFALGAWDRRATLAQLEDGAVCVLLDETGTSGAVVAHDGAVRAFGPAAAERADHATVLLDRWMADGAPTIAAWTATMALTGAPTHPIWVPHHWHPR